MATNVPVTLDTLITIKVSIQGNNRKFKIPLRDLGPNALPTKLRILLGIPTNQEVVFERFSDSAGAYIVLDSSNAQVYKTLFRAAKAKLKLRLRANVKPNDVEKQENEEKSAEEGPEAAAATATVLQLPISNVLAPPSPQPHEFAAVMGLPTRVKTNNDVMAAVKDSMNATDTDSSIAHSISARENFIAELANLTRQRNLALRTKKDQQATLSAMTSWSVFCNACDKPMMNEHFHCSVCDDGDYDLCTPCVSEGRHCPGDGHWLLKRFVENGKVISSTTERIAPKAKLDTAKEMPGAFTEEKKFDEPEQPLEEDIQELRPTRTCNCCVKVYEESRFITCVDCEDYDLCIPCHNSGKHGHHPGHTFQPATGETTLSAFEERLCAPGRYVRHAAICDGCDKLIYGVRHKCLNCPDWDYCSKCIKSAKIIHPRHRFVPIFDALPERRSSSAKHFGIYCDGPLCKEKTTQCYIEGVRYKCAVCHDTDFCENCEAIPHNKHNRTHPLIMFKTPVRSVSITTMGSNRDGTTIGPLGDQPPTRKSTSTETLPIPFANASTQVQTVVDLKPVEPHAPPKPPKEKIEIKDLLAEPIQERVKMEDMLSPSPKEVAASEAEASVKAEPAIKNEKPDGVPCSDLNAHFIRDIVPDGSTYAPEQRFTQVWTLRNPGPWTWPAGCSVRYVGGDNMLNVDICFPSSAVEIAEATESNVVGRPVEVGEEISFRVLMKAPKREGVAISYWRLKAADGTPFGHRLWCHIEVKKPTEQTPQSNEQRSCVQPDSSVTNLESNNVWKLQALLQDQQNKLKQQKERLDNVRASLEESVDKASKEQEYQERRKKAIDDMRAESDNLAREIRQRMGDLSSEESISYLRTKLRLEADKVNSTSISAPSAAAAAKSEQIESQQSQMIFPQLEKESPQHSVHEETAKQDVASSTPFSPMLKTETVMSPSERSVDIFDDADTLEFFDAESSDDDGFATDEEYDLIDGEDAM